MQPHQLAGAGLNPDKLGVAAALWDGALVLAGYLAAQPAYKYLGADVGAGAGSEEGASWRQARHAVPAGCMLMQRCRQMTELGGSWSE